MRKSAIACFALLVGSAALALATPADADVLPNVNLVFEPFHANGIYKVGERAGWTVHALLGAGYTRYDYVLRENNLRVIKSGTLDLSSGTGTIETTLDHPGMLYARLRFAGLPVPAAAATPAEISQIDSGLKNLLADKDPALKAVFDRNPGFALLAPATMAPTPQELDKMTVGAAVAPMDIGPGAPRPADFDAFWAGKLALLKKVPINPRLESTASDQANVELSTVTLDSVGSQVHGYLATPKGEGRHPALVIYQYAGVYPLQKSNVTDRAAEGWLAFDVDSHDMPPDAATAPRDYAQIGNTGRETSYFLNMYLRDTRALDYIQSRSDWDGKTIVIMGMSMGGQQSFATAGLNPGRVTAMIVNVPAGADFSGDLYGHKSGYPNWPTDDARAVEAARYFDAMNFAPNITAISSVAMGFIDTTSPPYGVFAAFNQIKGPKEVVPMIESDHNNITPQKEGAYFRRSKQALDSLRTTGSFAPNPGWAAGN